MEVHGPEATIESDSEVVLIATGDTSEPIKLTGLRPFQFKFLKPVTQIFVTNQLSGFESSGS